MLTCVSNFALPEGDKEWRWPASSAASLIMLIYIHVLNMTMMQPQLTEPQPFWSYQGWSWCSHNWLNPNPSETIKDHDAATTDNVPSVGPSVLTHIKYSFHFFQELPEKWNKLSSETTAACTLDTAMPGVSLAASFFSRPHTPPQPPALERDSTLVVVVVVVVVVQELFSLMMSAICVQIRGHRSEVMKIFTAWLKVLIYRCVLTTVDL